MTKKYTSEQRAWCEAYEKLTGFDPLMCDFEAGNESFITAAKNSKKWFEDWSSDMLRSIPDMPGANA